MTQGFWQTPQGGYVLNLLAAATASGANELKTRFTRARARRGGLQPICEQLEALGTWVSSSDLAAWLDGVGDDVWQSMQSSTVAGLAPAATSFATNFSSSCSPDRAAEAVALIGVGLIAVDDPELRDAWRSAGVIQRLQEVHSDQLDIFELILTEVFRLQDVAVFNRAPGRGRPSRFWADPRVRGTVHREEAVEEVISHLLSSTTRPVAVTSVRGAGGTGKTVLAREVCYDQRVFDAFPGGVFWVVLGEESVANVEAAARSLYTQVTGRAASATAKTTLLLTDELARIGDRLLVVLDDLWDSEHYSLLTAGWPDNVSVLVTTRGASLGGPEVRVDEMTANDSLAVMAGDAQITAEIAPALDDLATFLGRWALLLRLAGGFLAPEIQAGNLVALEKAIVGLMRDMGEDPTVLDDPASRSRSLDAVIRRSRAATGRAGPLFDRMSVFPADAAIPSDVLAQLWDASPTLVRNSCDVLARVGLVEMRQHTHDAFTVRVHDLVVAWLHHQHGKPGSPALAALHARCAAWDRRAPLLPGVADWMHFHLVCAEQWDDLLTLAHPNVSDQFRAATGSDSAFLAGSRAAAAAALAKDESYVTDAVWLASRWAASRLLSQLRNLPIELIAAEAALRNFEAALSTTAELEDSDAVRAALRIVDVDAADDELVACVLSIGAGLSPYHRSQLRAGVATRIHAVDPGDPDRYARALAIIGDADSYHSGDAIVRMTVDMVAANDGDLEAMEIAKSVAATLQDGWLSGRLWAELIDLARQYQADERQYLSHLVDAARNAGEAWERLTLWSKVFDRLVDDNGPDRKIALESALETLLEIEQNRGVNFRDLVKRCRSTSLDIDSVKRLSRLAEEVPCPEIMAWLAEQGRSADLSWGAEALERSISAISRLDSFWQPYEIEFLWTTLAEAKPGDKRAVEQLLRIAGDADGWRARRILVSAAWCAMQGVSENVEATSLALSIIEQLPALDRDQAISDLVGRALLDVNDQRLIDLSMALVERIGALAIRGRAQVAIVRALVAAGALSAAVEHANSILDGDSIAQAKLLLSGVDALLEKRRSLVREALDAAMRTLSEPGRSLSNRTLKMLALAVADGFPAELQALEEAFDVLCIMPDDIERRSVSDEILERACSTDPPQLELLERLLDFERASDVRWFRRAAALAAQATAGRSRDLARTLLDRAYDEMEVKGENSGSRDAAIAAFVLDAVRASAMDDDLDLLLELLTSVDWSPNSAECIATAWYRIRKVDADRAALLLEKSVTNLLAGPRETVGLRGLCQLADAISQLDPESAGGLVDHAASVYFDASQETQQSVVDSIMKVTVAAGQGSGASIDGAELLTRGLPDDRLRTALRKLAVLTAPFNKDRADSILERTVQKGAVGADAERDIVDVEIRRFEIDPSDPDRFARAMAATDSLRSAPVSPNDRRTEGLVRRVTTQLEASGEPSAAVATRVLMAAERLSVEERALQMTRFALTLDPSEARFASELVSRTETLLDESSPPERSQARATRARVACHLVALKLRTGAIDEAWSALDEAETWAMSLEDDPEQAVEQSSALRSLSVAVGASASSDSDAFARALSLAERISDPWSASGCLANLGGCLAAVDRAAARGLLDRALRTAEASVDQAVVAVNEYRDSCIAADQQLSVGAVCAWAAFIGWKGWPRASP